MTATKKVVSKFPNAIVKPNKKSSCEGYVIKTAKVAARINSVDEITPPS